MWQQWVNALLGLWTIAVPFMGFSGNTLVWSLMITGLAIAVLSIWSMQEKTSKDVRWTQRAHP